jgi:hypothetical protein
MRIALLVGALFAGVIAVLAALIYNVPEFVDFRGPPYLGWKEFAEFKPLGHGLHKIEIFWHMTPLHAEVWLHYMWDLH